MNIAEQAAHEVMKRSAMHIAAAMIHGEYPERDRAYSAAHDVEREVDGFIALVKRSITMLGSDPDEVWTLPAEVSESPTFRVDAVRRIIADHLAGAYVSGNSWQVACAKELETALDNAGMNIDRQVDSIVLEQMRRTPSNRGTEGRTHSCPF
jgi:hypothetical protein